jgi:hypothetical protein
VGGWDGGVYFNWHCEVDSCVNTPFNSGAQKLDSVGRLFLLSPAVSLSHGDRASLS